jgi:cyanophycinase
MIIDGRFFVRIPDSGAGACGGSTAQLRCPAMSIHLVGGGRPSTHDGVVYAPFVSEAATHAAGRGVQRPRIGLVAVADDEEELQEQVIRFTAVLTGRGECDVVAFPLRPGDRLEPTSLASLDGLLVAGGLTPAYHQALMPASDDIAGRVACGRGRSLIRGQRRRP